MKRRVKRLREKAARRAALEARGGAASAVESYSAWDEQPGGSSDGGAKDSEAANDGRLKQELIGGGRGDVRIFLLLDSEASLSQADVILFRTAHFTVLDSIFWGNCNGSVFKFLFQ